MKEETIIKLEELGFKHNDQKKGLWEKNIDAATTAYWDFRTKQNGTFYVYMGQGKETPSDAQKRPEYNIIRELQGQKTINGKNPLAKVEVIPPQNNQQKNNAETSLVIPRINEDGITNLISNHHNLKIIAKASKDKKGEGVLYHKLGEKIGLEPSAELIDMIALHLGGIQTEIVEQGMHTLTDPLTENVYHTYYAIVKAIDTFSGTTGIGSAEEPIDYKDFENGGKSFALVNCIRKAERNAKIRVIPVPKSALVTLVQELMAKIPRGNGGGTQ